MNFHNNPSYLGHLTSKLMAIYRDSTVVKLGTGTAFDPVYSPGDTATYSGIYRCTGCNKEISHNANVSLPPQNHHQHPNSTPVQWKMVVYAETNG